MSSAGLWYDDHGCIDLQLKHVLQLSLGDARSYFISTARNDLGVIFATSETGKEAGFLDTVLLN